MNRRESYNRSRSRRDSSSSSDYGHRYHRRGGKSYHRRGHSQYRELSSSPEYRYSEHRHLRDHSKHCSRRHDFDTKIVSNHRASSHHRAMHRHSSSPSLSSSSESSSTPLN